MYLEKLIASAAALSASLLVALQGERVIHGFTAVCRHYAHVCDLVAAWGN